MHRSITKRQITELLKQDEDKRISRSMLQGFLDNPHRFVGHFPTIVENPMGLTALVQRAVLHNKSRIHQSIVPENFKLEDGLRKVNLELEPFIKDETGEQAANRLVADGYKLEGIGELAQFLFDNPKEVEKYSWVVALSEASRWTSPEGFVCVPIVSADDVGSYQLFTIVRFDFKFFADYRVLVSRQ